MNKEQRTKNKEQRTVKLIPSLVNYKKIFKYDVEIASTILARDYKGFGSGLIPSNGVIVEE